MKPVVLASLLFACSPLVAQQLGQSFGVAGMQSADGTKTQAIVLPISSCPVEMHARQGGGMQMLRADDGTKHPVMTPSLDLTPRDQRTIVSVVVTAYGYEGHGGAAIPASDDLVLRDKKTRDKVSRQLTIRFKASQPRTVTAQLSLTGFTVVEFIELNALTYADGSTWKLAADLGCTVKPDPLLLVGAR